VGDNSFVTVQGEVLAAAERRAAALTAGDENVLRTLLHPDFVWTSHTGEQFALEEYLSSNLSGRTRWHAQVLRDSNVIVVGATAVLTCVVVDDVTTGGGREEFEMPMTQTWVRTHAGWQCLAGHAGPRLGSR
jgi:hypothetical protein